MNARIGTSLLRHVYWHRRSQGAMWLPVAAAALLLLTGPVAWLMHLPPRLTAMIVATLLYFFVTFWWQALVSAAMKLNTPANARLVPFGDVPAKQIVAWTLVLLSVIGAAAGKLLFDAAILGAVLTGLLLTGSALLAAGRTEGLVVAVGALFGGFYVAQHEGGEQARTVLAAGALLLAPCATYLLLCLFPRSSERHWRDLARFERNNAYVSGQLDALPDAVPGWIGRVYAACLQRDCAARRQGALLGHVFGPRAHWTLALVGGGVFMILCLLLSLAVHALPEQHPAADFLQGFMQAMQTVAPAMLLVAVVQAVRVRQARTAVEQGLVRLAPGMAQGRALNRLLARRWLLQGVATGIGSLLWIVVAHMAAGAPFEVAMTVAAIVSPLLLFIPLLLRDVAAMGNPMHVGTLALTLLGAACLPTGLALLRLNGVDLSWLVLLPISAALSAGMIWWRWQALVGGPVALPVGRLAS
jgi:hypothetical protein